MSGIVKSLFCSTKFAFCALLANAHDRTGSFPLQPSPMKLQPHPHFGIITMIGEGLQIIGPLSWGGGAMIGKTHLASSLLVTNCLHVQVSVLLVALIFIFASYGVQTLAGKLYRCNDVTIGTQMECTGNYMQKIAVVKYLHIGTPEELPSIYVPRVW